MTTAFPSKVDLQDAKSDEIALSNNINDGPRNVKNLNSSAVKNKNIKHFDIFNQKKHSHVSKKPQNNFKPSKKIMQTVLKVPQKT